MSREYVDSFSVAGERYMIIYDSTADKITLQDEATHYEYEFNNMDKLIDLWHCINPTKDIIPSSDVVEMLAYLRWTDDHLICVG